MAVIPASEARALYTKMLMDVYYERPMVTSFLRSFFPNKEAATKYISIQVRRGKEKVAVDVLRGTEGNRNTFSRSTEKVIEPPYYREYFELTDLDLYDRLFGSTDIDDGIFTQFLEDVAEKMRILVDTIERAYELQCSQVLQTGIVTLKEGTNIDFKRKAGSLVNKSGTPWTGGVDPYADMEDAGNFLRQVGKIQGGTLNAIYGADAFMAFINNTTVKGRGPFSNVNFDMLRAPQRDSVGGTFHGIISAGPYKVNIWTYNEFYDNASDVSTPYIDPTNVIVLPENPHFMLSFAAVPQLITPTNTKIKKGAYLFDEYTDERKTSHVMDVKSAGIAVPTAVDQMYTMKVLP